MTRIRHTLPGLVVLGALALAAPARAQAPSTSGPLVLEELREGFAVAPENRFTDFDGELGNLVGGFLGMLTDDSFFIGGGGYWLSNGSRTRELAYGGLIAEWTVARSERVGFALRTLVGGGAATLPTEVTFRGREPRRPYAFHDGPFHDGRREIDPGEPVTATVGLGRSFFVVEPQASLTLGVNRWMRLGLGVGYRFVDGAGSMDERLRGVSGSVSVQLGSF